MSPITDQLVQTTLAAIESARRMSDRGTIPPPLIDSPKCGRCSLHALCLPDETNALKGVEPNTIRPYVAPGDDAVPLYVLEPGARLGLSGEVLQVRTDAGVIADVRLLELASVSLFGNVQMSSQAMRAVLERDIPIFYLSYGGWLSGYARSVNDHSLDLRIAQHEIARDPERSLALARALVVGKVKNGRLSVGPRLVERNAARSCPAFRLLCGLLGMFDLRFGARVRPRSLAVLRLGFFDLLFGAIEIRRARHLETGRQRPRTDRARIARGEPVSQMGGRVRALGPIQRGACLC